jgi:hypothetical protein
VKQAYLERISKVPTDDQAVTIRSRDTMVQDRVSLDSVAGYLPDREDARASAPVLADSIVALHDHIVAMQRLAAHLVVLRLSPADLAEPVPAWETNVAPGEVAVAVIEWEPSPRTDVVMLKFPPASGMKFPPLIPLIGRAMGTWIWIF